MMLAKVRDFLRVIPPYFRPLPQVMDMVTLLGIEVWDGVAFAYTKDGAVSVVLGIEGGQASRDEEVALAQWQLRHDFLAHLEGITVSHWVHRLRENLVDEEADLGHPVANQIAERWNAQFVNSLVNRQYLQLTYSAGSGRENAHEAARMVVDKALAVCTSLRPFNPRVLTPQALAEFFGVLVNGEHLPVPADSYAMLDEILPGRNIEFSQGQVIFQGMSERLGAFSTMRFLQRESHDKILNQLLVVPYEFVLCQHFKPFSKGDALSMLAGRQRYMKVFVFGAHVLEEELEEVLGDLQANKIALLEHALCVMVLAEDEKELGKAQKEVSAALEHEGVRVWQEHLLAETCFQQFFHGKHHYNPRVRKITSANAADFLSLRGDAAGHDACPWGEHPVARFSTPAGGKVGFAFHQDASPGALGHTLVVGRSGAVPTCPPGQKGLWGAAFF